MATLRIINGVLYLEKEESTAYIRTVYTHVYINKAVSSGTTPKTLTPAASHSASLSTKVTVLVQPNISANHSASLSTAVSGAIEKTLTPSASHAASLGTITSRSRTHAYGASHSSSVVKGVRVSFSYSSGNLSTIDPDQSIFRTLVYSANHTPSLSTEVGATPKETFTPSAIHTSSLSTKGYWNFLQTPNAIHSASLSTIVSRFRSFSYGATHTASLNINSGNFVTPDMNAIHSADLSYMLRTTKQYSAIHSVGVQKAVFKTIGIASSHTAAVVTSWKTANNYSYGATHTASLSTRFVPKPEPSEAGGKGSIPITIGIGIH